MLECAGPRCNACSAIFFELSEVRVARVERVKHTDAVIISSSQHLRQREREQESEGHVAREKERLAERTSGRVRWRYIERVRQRAGERGTCSQRQGETCRGNERKSTMGEH